MPKPAPSKRTCALLAGLALLVPVHLAAEAISRDQANELLRAYARTYVPKQPRDVRAAWRGKTDRVQLNEHDLFGLIGIDGGIFFEYFPEAGTFDCLSKVHGFRKVVHPWIFRALQEATAGGKDLEGTELIYDEISTNIFVRERFEHLPSEREFIRTCDRVMRVGERWFRDLYLPAVQAFYARNVPAASATATLDSFRVTLVATESSEAFLDVWDRQPTAREPEVWTLQSVELERDFWLFFLFEGCTEDLDGSCAVGSDFEILRPDGSVLGSVANFAIWLGPSPPDGHLQPSQNNVTLRFSDEEPGDYRVAATVCDASRERCVEVTLPLRVEAASPPGGG